MIASKKVRDDDPLQAPLAKLVAEVQAAALPAGCKQTATWCIGQLPDLYSKLRQTSENRFNDEIRRLVQGLLKELATSQANCQEARELFTSIPDQLQVLHEQFGLPGLNLKPIARTTPRPRKAG